MQAAHIRADLRHDVIYHVQSVSGTGARLGLPVERLDRGHVCPRWCSAHRLGPMHDPLLALRPQQRAPVVRWGEQRPHAEAVEVEGLLGHSVLFPCLAAVVLNSSLVILPLAKPISKLRPFSAPSE